VLDLINLSRFSMGAVVELQEPNPHLWSSLLAYVDWHNLIPA
jgi:hypothetical protein